MGLLRLLKRWSIAIWKCVHGCHEEDSQTFLGHHMCYTYTRSNCDMLWFERFIFYFKENIHKWVVRHWSMLSRVVVYPHYRLYWSSLVLGMVSLWPLKFLAIGTRNVLCFHLHLGNWLVKVIPQVHTSSHEQNPVSHSVVETGRYDKMCKTGLMCGCNYPNAEDNSHHKVPKSYLPGRRTH